MLTFCLISIFAVSMYLACTILFPNNPQPQQKPLTIYKRKLPHHIAKHYPANLRIVGGSARVAMYCYLHKKKYPEGYIPRDMDYLWYRKEKYPECSEGEDHIACSSLQEYFRKIDLHTNSVMVSDGYIHFTEAALDCYSNGYIAVNKENNAFAFKGRRKHTTSQYLYLRMAIQAGYNVNTGKYIKRNCSLKLTPDASQYIDNIPKSHWYMETYNFKLVQIKTGNH
jgi:hypothetical protein